MPDATMQQPALTFRVPFSSRCSIYAYGLDRAAKPAEELLLPAAKRGRRVELPPPPPYATADAWMDDQYATELWLQRALISHPWRTDSHANASVAFIAANLTMSCLAQSDRHRIHFRSWWTRLLSDVRLWPNETSTRPTTKVLTNIYRRCAPPWLPQEPPSDLVVLENYLHPGASHSQRRRMLVTPMVVARPAWLVAEDNPGPPNSSMRPPANNQSTNRLVFFAGHVPKLYVRATRYHVWRKLQAHRSAVTIASSDLSCTIGSYAAACPLGEDFLRKQSQSFFDSFCAPYCNRSWMIDRDAKGALKPAHCDHPNPGASVADRASSLIAKCKEHAMIDPDWWRSLGAMVEDTKLLSHDEYITMAFTHRYCLVVPGDYSSTHKIFETIAVGGAGGCVPVFVVPSPARNRPTDAMVEDGVASLLPYTTWLDYCEVSFVVSEWQARRDIGVAIQKLAAMPESVLEAKQRGLRAVRDAFVFRRNSSVGSPSAPEFIIDEVCRAAEEVSRTRSFTSGRHSREARWSIAGSERYHRCRLD